MTLILESTPPSKDYVSIHQSDVAAFCSQPLCAVWINGTQPALIPVPPGRIPLPEDAALPKNDFPFKRLASVSDSSATYLYHQMNGTTFAEEQWDDTLRAWIRTEYITISNL